MTFLFLEEESVVTGRLILLVRLNDWPLRGTLILSLSLIHSDFIYRGPYWEPNLPTSSTEENVLSKGCWRSRLGTILCDNIDVLQPWSQWPSITWNTLWTIKVSLVKSTCREPHRVVSMCASLMFHTLRILKEHKWRDCVLWRDFWLCPRKTSLDSQL